LPSEEIAMIAETSASPEARAHRRGLCAHAAGLAGANLAIGAFAIWAIPQAIALSQQSWALPCLLAPWGSTAGTVTPLALLGDALVLLAAAAGITIIRRAAQMLPRY
jgi:hypothetical protein